MNTQTQKTLGFKPLLYSVCWLKAVTQTMKQRALMARMYRAHSTSTTNTNIS